MTAFDLARDILMTPKRIEFVRQTESKLFNALMHVAQRNQDHIRILIGQTLVGMREELLEAAKEYTFKGAAGACDHPSFLILFPLSRFRF